MTKITSFWLATEIILTKPHVVNKRVWGCRILARNSYKSTDTDIKWKSPFHRLRDLNNVNGYLQEVLSYLKLFEFSSDEEADVELMIIELLPRCFTDNRAYQLIYLHKLYNWISFIDITPEGLTQNICPDFAYKFILDNSCTLKLDALNEKDLKSKAWIWLKKTLFPQFVKWCIDFDENTEKKQFCNDSLALVASEKYYLKYNYLKLKYGKEMVKIWPECTDPSKFVYEDIAIATYILLLWESCSESGVKQKFVDLGCGNGLLVYILIKEGHEGCGLDVRKRNIWDLYPEDVILKEKTIVPSNSCLFPDADWIIGNHSDELTPWIPVIAARSSYNCNFFLLPCCAYNFDGTKYQRKNSSKSQYTEYLEHVQELSEKCGFITQIDRLKIPSTKRICLIGNGRNYSENEQTINCNSIKNLINESTKDNWIQNYKTREPVEKVRNCTQIDKNIINTIVECTAKYLLEGNDISSQSEWNSGKLVAISELVTQLPQDKLNSLKSECGGLATLLKNNHHIFKVQNGKIQFRYPKSVSEISNMSTSKRSKGIIKVKQRPCWFHKNHPQGCPLSNTNCSYQHS